VRKGNDRRDCGIEVEKGRWERGIKDWVERWMNGRTDRRMEGRENDKREMEREGRSKIGREDGSISMNE